MSCHQLKTRRNIRSIHFNSVIQAVDKMVDSVVSFVLKVTEDWGRKLVTQKLRSGGAFAHSLSNLIEAELSTMRRQLEALTRKDLDESIDLFLEGLASYYLQANDNKADASPQIPQRKKMKTIDEIDASEILDARKSLSVETKERFKDARKKAGSAIANEAMKTKDVILATFIKVLSQLLESDDLATALNFCLHYLQRLHSREEVKKNFKDELKYIETKNTWQLAFGSIDARKMIWCVCRLNRFVFDVAQENGEASPELFKQWPCVEIERKTTKEVIKIDPLRDPRLSDVFKLEKRPFSIAPPLSDKNDARKEESRPQPASGRAETTSCAEYNNEEASSPSTHETPEHHAKDVTLGSSQTTSKVKKELFPKVGTKRKREEEEEESN